MHPCAIVPPAFWHYDEGTSVPQGPLKRLQIRNRSLETKVVRNEFRAAGSAHGRTIVVTIPFSHHDDHMVPTPRDGRHSEERQKVEVEVLWSGFFVLRLGGSFLCLEIALGFGVRGSGVGVRGLGFGVCGWCFGFGGCGLGFSRRYLGFGVWSPMLGFRV